MITTIATNVIGFDFIVILALGFSFSLETNGACKRPHWQQQSNVRVLLKKRWLNKSAVTRCVFPRQPFRFSFVDFQQYDWPSKHPKHLFTRSQKKWVVSEDIISFWYPRISFCNKVFPKLIFVYVTMWISIIVVGPQVLHQMITELEARVDEDPVREITEKEQVSALGPCSYGGRSRFCFEKKLHLNCGNMHANNTKQVKPIGKLVIAIWFN